MSSAPRPLTLALLSVAAALTAGTLAVVGAHLLARRRLPRPSGTWRPVPD